MNLNNDIPRTREDWLELLNRGLDSMEAEGLENFPQSTIDLVVSEITRMSQLPEGTVFQTYEEES